MTTIKSAAKAAHSKHIAGGMAREASGRFAGKVDPAAASGEATAASEATAAAAASGEAPASRPKDRLFSRLHRDR